jgi:hypothetical protein
LASDPDYRNPNVRATTIEYYNRTMARPFKWKYRPLRE